uniref:Uncharacterized protein n=1 Tax=Aromatoleum buckelii TaxID=200254 RepID=A0ABX1N7B0_9RHOO
MAKRPVYIPNSSGKILVRTESVEFNWHSGMAVMQKQKSIRSLHEAAVAKHLCGSPLEISSKSEVELGVALSAFNLKVTTQKLQKIFTVETAYQSSKVFANGGPYKDLLYGTSRAAKKDPRIRESGSLRYFEFFGETWPLEPRTAFYDWLYINALHKNKWAVEQLSDYDAFTDIEFNPEKSINCQAYSVALYRSLEAHNLIREATANREAYMDIISSGPVNNASENTELQPRLV